MSQYRRSKSLQHASESSADGTLGSGEDNALGSTQQERLVKLNVGGRKFDTTEATLVSKGSNFLSSLVSSQMPSIRDDSGRYFIDRSGSIFEVLLEYLRTGILHIPPHISWPALALEADFFGISLPHESSKSNKLSGGLFVSSKYAENEIVVFSDMSTGYIVRGGSSKVQFRYKTEGDGVIEVVWQSSEKGSRNARSIQSSTQTGAAQTQISLSKDSPSSRDRLTTSSPTASSTKHASTPSSSSKRRQGRSGSTHVDNGTNQNSGEELLASSSASNLATASSSTSNTTDDIASLLLATIWFQQGPHLITTASNTYTFLPNLTSFPSCIYTNAKNGIAIYEGHVQGFRLPKCDSPPPLLFSFNNNSRKQGSDELGPESPPPTSPKSDGENTLSNDSDSSEDSKDAVFLDLRNHWVKCEYSIVPYCDSVVSYQITCRPIESVRYKSSLPFPFGGTNEYEWCREVLKFELIVLEEHLIARLASYTLIRKDRSIVNMQYSAAFHKFYKLGKGPALFQSSSSTQIHLD